jgi:hypothetical protein
MTTEEKTKKNPTYQAINQTNAPEVKEALNALYLYEKELADIQDKIKAALPELIAERDRWRDAVSCKTAEIKELIQEHGSYQDAEAGEYALVYERKTPQYDAQAFKARYPQYVPAVIVEAVNAEALKGLIKGGLLSQPELEIHDERGRTPVITYRTAQITVIQ